MKKHALGVDIGNVIIDFRQIDKDDKEFLENRYSTIPAAEDVFDALKVLNEHLNGRVYLISKATDWGQKKIIAWLADNDFHIKTGIDPKNVIFVGERHEKAYFIEKLGLTHFVDDRLEVLSHMVGLVPHLFLFGPDEGEVEGFKEFLSGVFVVGGWKDLLARINP